MLGRVVRLNNEEYSYSPNGKTQFKANLVNRFIVDDIGDWIGLKKAGQGGIKIDGEFIGLGGFYYHYDYLGSTSIASFLNSWEWFINELNVNKEEFETALETTAIKYLVEDGIGANLLFDMFAVVIELNNLRKIGVDVGQKVLEVKSNVKGNLRKYKGFKIKQDVDEATSRVKNFLIYVQSLSSETMLATYAKVHGFKVELGKNPDLTVNDRGFEVKRKVRPTCVGVGLPESIVKAYENIFDLSSLSRRVSNGKSQECDIIAIDVNERDLRDKKCFEDINGFKGTWLAPAELRKSLQTALSFHHSTKKCVLLFLQHR
jgi:hypothetical protein